MSQPTTPISPASPTEAKSALRALFEAFPTGDRGDGIAAIGTYLMAIDGYPLAAIQMAVLRLIRGEVDDVDKRFLPTPAQLSNLVRYCERLVTPVGPRQALPAPAHIEPTEAERLRVSDKVRKWVQDREPKPQDAWQPREPHQIATEFALGKLKLSAEAIFVSTPPSSQTEEAA